MQISNPQKRAISQRIAFKWNILPSTDTSVGHGAKTWHVVASNCGLNKEALRVINSMPKDEGILLFVCYLSMG